MVDCVELPKDFLCTAVKIIMLDTAMVGLRRSPQLVIQIFIVMDPQSDHSSLIDVSLRGEGTPDRVLLGVKGFIEGSFGLVEVALL